MTTRYLAIAVRRRGLLVAAALHAALGAAFVAAWGESGRMPALPGVSLHDQLLTIEALFMAVASPWVAARLLGQEARSDADRLSLHYGVPPTSLTAARYIAVTVWILVVQASILPAVLEMQQRSGTSPVTAAAAQAVILALGLGGATLAVALATFTDHPLVRWIGPAAVMVTLTMAAA